MKLRNHLKKSGYFFSYVAHHLGYGSKSQPSTAMSGLFNGRRTLTDAQRQLLMTNFSATAEMFEPTKNGRWRCV